MKKSIKPIRSIKIIFLTLALVLSCLNPCLADAAESLSAGERATTKKGLQIALPQMDQAIETGCSTVFCNFSFSDYIVIDDFENPNPAENEYVYGGKTYCINTWVMESFNEWIRYGKENGVEKVYMQLMSQELPGLTDTTPSSAIFHAFDVWTDVGRANVEKFFACAAKYMPLVDYWIVGNEVDEPHHYYEMGNVDTDAFSKNYEATMRIINDKAKIYNPKAHVMLCTDYFWNSTFGNRHKTKDILNNIVTLTAQDPYDWGVAIHPYSDPLTDANFADDYVNGLVTNDENTQIITMYNLDVFTNYMQKSQNLYNGKVRPIAITEIGYTAYRNGTVEDQLAQAAYFAYAYYKAEANPYIDAFTIRAYNDAPEEAVQGLYFGLFDLNGNKRLIYDVMKNINTSQSRDYTNQLLATLGVSTWNALIPGFDNLSFFKEKTFGGLYYDSILKRYVYMKSGEIDRTYSGFAASNGLIAYIINGMGEDTLNYVVKTKVGAAGTKINVDILDNTTVDYYFMDDESIAKVTADGTVIPVSAGITYLDILSDNGTAGGAAQIKIEVATPFKDVDLNKWYGKGVAYVFNNGIMTGYNDGVTFGTNDNLTRAQVVTVLYRMAGSPEVSGTVPFPDIVYNSYYSKALVWAYQNGIITGYKNGLFGPNDKTLRQDYAVMLYRYARVMGYNTDMINGESYKDVSDYATVSNYAQASVYLMHDRGIMGMASDFKPFDTITRAETATMMMRFAAGFTQ